MSVGEAAPYLEGFVSEMADVGFAELTIAGYMNSAIHFGGWLEAQGVSLLDISENTMKAFGAHRCQCPGHRSHKCLSRHYLARVERFAGYLAKRGVIRPVANTVPETPPSLIAFRQWVLQHRGLSPVTIARHERLMKLMLPALGTDAGQYTATTVITVILDQIRGCRPAHAKNFVGALRIYLWVLATTGACQPGLDHVVPTVAEWRLSSLPRYLDATQVTRLNDWQEATLLVRGKGRRDVRLPLPQDAGDAVLAYLERERAQVPIDRIFLCTNAPFRALRSGGAVSNIVEAALRAAGIENPPSRGANLIRHTAATSMLRAGATLDEIGTVLRHKSPDTTAHYAKVDVATLQQIAQPWPGQKEGR